MSNNVTEPMYEVGKKYCIHGKEFMVVFMEMGDATLSNNHVYRIPFYKILLTQENIMTYMSQQDILDDNFKYFKPTYVFNGIVGMYSRNLKQDIRFNVWVDMIYRCYRHKENTYRYFGGRGITVCDRWKVYKYFLYDWARISRSELTENVQRKYVMQLKPYCTAYSITTSYVSDYYNSDVYKAVQELTAEKSAASFNSKPKTSSPIHFYGDQAQQYQQQSVQNVPPPEKTAQNNIIMLDGSVVSMDSLATNPSLEDYQKVINDTSFMDELPEPGSGGSKTTYPFNLEHGPLTPYNSKRKKKDMCIVVDK